MGIAYSLKVASGCAVVVLVTWLRAPEQEKVEPEDSVSAGSGINPVRQWRFCGLRQDGSPGPDRGQPFVRRYSSLTGEGVQWFSWQNPAEVRIVWG